MIFGFRVWIGLFVMWILIANCVLIADGSFLDGGIDTDGKSISQTDQLNQIADQKVGLGSVPSLYSMIKQMFVWEDDFYNTNLLTVLLRMFLLCITLAIAVPFMMKCIELLIAMIRGFMPG